MRAAIPLQIAVSAATLLAACTPTGPGGADVSELLVLTVAPSSANIDGGDFVKLRATVYGDDGLITTPVEVTWSSSDPTIAIVGTDGLVEGRKAGEARINATWQNAHGSAWVQVARAQKEIPDDPSCMKRLPVPEKNSIPDTGC